MVDQGDWNPAHFPGCPVRYGMGTECVDPDFLCAPRTSEPEESD